MPTFEISPSAVAGINRRVPARRPSCGTRSGAVLHRNNKEHVCKDCRIAENDYMRKRRNTTVARVKELELEIAQLRAGKSVEESDGFVTIPVDLFVDLYLTADIPVCDRADTIVGPERVTEMVRANDKKGKK